MVLVFEGTPEQFSMDGYLKQNLDIAKKVIRKDWDMLFLYDGNEGSGKSVKAMQDAKYCDASLCLDRITFNPKEFKTAILSASPYQAVIYDEAYTGLNSRSTMSMINRTLVSMLAEIRQKNLFVFVVMPTFFDLDKYVALFRSRLLIHVYTGDNFERGFFAFYNVDRKKDLYILGKKFYSYSKPKFNFNGRFSNHYTINEAEYRKKKYEALNKRQADEQSKEIYLEAMNMMFSRLQEVEIGLTHDLKMKIMGMPQSTYYLKLKQWSDRRGN